NNSNTCTSFNTHIPPPPRSTLFPYTTLFRSEIADNPAEGPAYATPVAMGPGPASVDTSREYLLELYAEQQQIVESLEKNTRTNRSEEHTSELQSLAYLVCRLLLEKKKKQTHK